MSASQSELQSALDNAPIGSNILVKPGIYDSIILRSGKKNYNLVTDATLGSGRVEDTWKDALVKVKSIKIEPKAEAYAFTGFEFLPINPGIATIYLGSDKETDPFNTPNDISFNQCIVSANPDTGGKRGIQMMCRKVQIVNCRLAGFWYNDDSQAVSCYNGPGPYYIYNSYLEASGENFMSGGAKTLNETMLPTYIEFMGNHCYKPESWKSQPLTTVKNLFELKECLEARISNNLFEGNWKDGQVGYAILITPRNQYNTAPFTVVKNVTFSWNVIRNVGAGINIMGDDNLAPTLQTENITIENNLIYDIDQVKHAGSAGVIFMSTRGPKNVIFRNNTCLGINKINSFMSYEGTPDSWIVEKNIFTEGSYGLKTSNGLLGYTAFKQTTLNSEFNNNYIIPSGVRSINYGPTNTKQINAIDKDTMRSLVDAGVDIDILRQHVVF